MNLQRLGRYQLHRLLATGGMGEIYLASACGLDGFEKRLVVKRIRPELANRDDLVAMFMQEARIVAKLNHANIVQVFDVGSEGGDCFLAMELLLGKDLRALMAAMAGEPLPLEHAVHIATAICSGLHHAHQAHNAQGLPFGIVHRDVSPANVFVTTEGQVKLLDFGVAKLSHQDGGSRSGALKGKLPYMSPEQARCVPQLDHRSDLFSTAILLWEMTTGRTLFLREQELDELRALCEEPVPPPTRLIPEYPPELERIVMKGLRRTPAERYQSAAEFQVDLEAFARAHSLALSPFALARFITTHFPEADSVGEVAQIASEQPTRSTNIHAPQQRKHESGKVHKPSRSVRSWLLLSLAAVLGLGFATTTWWLLRNQDTAQTRNATTVAPDQPTTSSKAPTSAASSEDLAPEPSGSAMEPTDAAPVQGDRPGVAQDAKQRDSKRRRTPKKRETGKKRAPTSGDAIPSRPESDDAPFPL